MSTPQRLNSTSSIEGHPVATSWALSYSVLLKRATVLSVGMHAKQNIWYPVTTNETCVRAPF